MMSRLVYCVLSSLLVSKSALADVQSCYACAGPQTDCVRNNRTDFLKMDCKTFKVENQSLIARTAQPDILERFDSEVGPREENSQIGCITLTFRHDTESPRDRALKTCVPAEVLGQDVCTYMEGLVSEIGGEKMDCYFCKENDCNSSISLAVRKSATIFLVIVYFCKYFL